MAKSDKPELTSAFELFGPSISLIKKYVGVYFVLLVLPVLLTSLDYASQDVTSPFTMFGSLLALIFMAPLLYAEVRTAGGHDVTLGEAFQRGYAYFWRLLGLVIIVGLLVVIGFILLIIPGLIILRRYILAPYVLVDRNTSISEAMKIAAEESKPFSWSIYGIMGVSFLIAFIGVLGLPGAIASTLLSVLYALAIVVRYFEVKKAYKQL